jgi:hypothetical protein
MRTFELRVYALCTKAALDFYAGRVYPATFTILGYSASRLTACGPRKPMKHIGSLC